MRLGGAVMRGLLRRQPVVAALAAGEIAGTPDRILIPELDALGVVNDFAMTTPARLFPLASGHARMLSHADRLNLRSKNPTSDWRSLYALLYQTDFCRPSTLSVSSCYGR